MNECTCNDSGTCSTCREARKKESQKNKPPKVIKNPKRTPIKKKVVEKKPIDLEALKGKNVQLKSSKRVKTQEELDEINKKKLAEKQRKAKERAKLKREEKKYSKEALLRDIQKLVRLTQPLHCFICKEPYHGNRIANGSHLLSRQYSATCYYAGNLSSGCNYCNNNTRTSGEQFFHSLEMDKLYGKGHSEMIFRMGKIGYKWSKPELIELRQLVDKYLSLVTKTENIVNKQKLWTDFKAEQEQMDFFKYLQEELAK